MWRELSLAFAKAGVTGSRRNGIQPTHFSPPAWDTLSIEIHDGETGKTVSREIYNLDLQDLRERGMVEVFVTATVRRRLGRENISK